MMCYLPHRFALASVLVAYCLAPLAAQDDLSALEEQALRAAVQKVAPSVVRIETIGGLERVGRVLISTAPTTGLAVSGDGYVISSAANFVQQPSSILVTLPSGARAAAKIVARDHSRMLVLLRVNTDEKLIVPQAVPKSEMRVGQWAVAVGRTFEASEPSVSIGVLSALNRIWSKAVQTDAKISPNNYGGPLVDIRGRVFGVLVPLSPQSEGELSGAEWYDSGIGFAVPLEDIQAHLDTLKEGKDLHPGLLGVSLKSGDMYSLPAQIAAAPPTTPAAKAGLKTGDVIVEVDGQPVTRQAQLRHSLGSHYAGDKVQVVVTRGEGRVAATVELAEKIEPYAHPFVGILPMRDGGPDAKHLVVRYVFPGSPAAEAGIKPGDKLISLNDKPAATALEAQTLLGGFDPQAKVALVLERDGQPVRLEVTPAALPTDIPAELPPAVAQELPKRDQPPTTGLVEIKLPEETNDCFAFVPENYHPAVPHGLVVWLHGAERFEKDAVETRWKELAAKHQLIILAPRAADGKKWEATEAGFVKKTIEDLIGRYNIDRTRVVAFGEQAGGSMAWFVSLQNPDRLRGLAVIDAVPPPRSKLPANDPVQRLAFFTGIADQSQLAPVMKALNERLVAAKFPVTVRSLGEKPRDLNAKELVELARWVDMLDRI